MPITQEDLSDAFDVAGTYCDESDICYSRGKQTLFVIVTDSQTENIIHALKCLNWELVSQQNNVRVMEIGPNWHKLGFQNPKRNQT